MTDRSVGQPIDRIDARRKVTGTATYAAEVDVANVAYAVIVCSRIAKGAIQSLDLEAARSAPGVLSVVAHDNAMKLGAAAKKTSPDQRVLQLLQGTTIHYADQPIAIAIADSLERAQYAAGLAAASYTGGAVGVALTDISHDLGNAYTSTGGRALEPNSRRGDFDKAFAAATTKVDATYSTPVENHNPMEMHATIAVWQGDDHLTLYDATQGIFSVRQRIAEIFGLSKENVRVISHYVGGGFGSKGSPWSHIALAAMCAKLVGRPVKLVLTRPQMFSLVGHRPKTVQRIALGADARGKLVAIHHATTSETSQFDDFLEPSAMQTRMLYSCPNVVTSHKLVRLDIPTPSQQRAPGEATGTFALESAMDELAYATKLDPLELRLRNYAIRDEQEDKPFSSKSLMDCYKRGADRFGWNKRKPNPRSTREGSALIGWGMATAVYPAQQFPASAIARLRLDGTALVQAGTQDIGTGTYTIMTQIAADALMLPVDRVRFELGDTEFPETPVSGGSSTASSTGSAVKLACLKLRSALGALALSDPASPLHGTPPELLDVADGALFVKGSPTKRDPYVEIMKRANKPEISAQIKTTLTDAHKTMSMHSFGATFVEVRVDEELGIVRVSRMVAAYAAGKILNAKTGRSQLLGGLVWAIGMALEEHTVRDAPTARVITRDLADYHVPVNADVPDIDVITVDEHDPYVNEVGAKGIGELGITGASAAIANAVFHATGTRIRDLPITLDKLMPGVRS